MLIVFNFILIVKMVKLSYVNVPFRDKELIIQFAF